MAKKTMLILTLMISARMWALLQFADRWMARDCGYCSAPLGYVIQPTHYEFLKDKP